MTCLLPGKMWFQESFNYTTNVSVSKTLLCEFIQLIPTSLIITKLKCLPNTKTLAKFFKYILLCNKSELLSSVQVLVFFFRINFAQKLLQGNWMYSYVTNQTTEIQNNFQMMCFFYSFFTFFFPFFFFLLQKSHFVISILKELIDNWYLVFLQNYKEEAWKEMKFYKSLSSFFFNICISRYICVSYIHISLNIKQSNRD